MEKSKALQNKIQIAINAQKKKIDEVNTYIDFLKGKQYKATPKKDDVTFNIIHTTVQAVLNSVLTGKSYIYIEPVSPEAIGTEDFVEKVINYWWKRLKVEKQVKLTAIDYTALGQGVTYVDWDFEVDKDDMIIADEPFALHIPYKDFLIDPNATAEEVYKAKYMIRRFVKPTKDLKADSRYKHTKNITGDSKLDDVISKGVPKEDAELTTLYQIWIPEDYASYVMRDGCPDILRTVENKFGREYPFVLMRNYEMPDELMPYGEVKILYEPQQTLNRIYSLVLKHAKKVSTRQYIANSLISREELRKLKDAEDGEVLSVEGNSKANDIITPIADAVLSGDVYRAYEMIQSAVVQLSSISEYRRSSMPKGERKATEAAYVEQATEMSTNTKEEDIGEHCEDIAKKIFILLKDKDNINMRDIVYKDQTSGQYMAEQYNNESFPGEHSYRWESGASAPINSNTKQNKAQTFINILKEIVSVSPMVAQRINWIELLRMTAKDFDIDSLEQVLTPDESMMPMQPGMEQPGMEQGQELDPNVVNAVMGQLNRY